MEILDATDDLTAADLSTDGADESWDVMVANPRRTRI